MQSTYSSGNCPIVVTCSSLWNIDTQPGSLIATGLLRCPGKVQDTVVDMEQLIPPMQRLSKKEKAELIHSTVFPLDVSADRQYLISLRHGVLVDKARLVEILTEGSYSKPESY